MDASEAYRLLIADVYELAGTSRRTSEAIAREAGQTVARWHVLSVLSGQSLTVAAVARRLGLARQSVHRVVNELVADGMVTATPNPDHKTAPLMVITLEGSRVLRELVRRADLDRGSRLAAASVSAAELQQARRVLSAVLHALAQEGASGQG